MPADFFRSFYEREQKENTEISRMFQYAGKYHGLTILSFILSGISTILSMLPFVYI